MRNKIIASMLLIGIALSFSCGAKERQEEEAPVTDAQQTRVEPVIEHVSLEGNALKVADRSGRVRSVNPVSPENTREDVAYALAIQIIRNICGIYSEVYGDAEDYDLNDREIGAFLQGFIDAVNGEEVDSDYMVDIGNRLQEDVDSRKARTETAAKSYFESLESRPGIVKTSSGLLYEVIEEGSGEGGISNDSTVNVDYVMSVYDPDAPGNMIEADSNDGVDFHLSNLIPGAIEGIKLMREGAEYVFYINPDLGYGPIAVSPVIGANSYLVFRVRVNSIAKEEESEELADTSSGSQDAEALSDAPDASEDAYGEDEDYGYYFGDE